jgi:hypothetical protein
MALYPFTTSTDFANKPKRQIGWQLSQGGTNAQTINFRSGGSGGPIMFQVQLAINSSAGQSYPEGAQPVFVNSLYVEIVSANFAQGSVNLA